jgi:acetamidase/formamidase
MQPLAQEYIMNEFIIRPRLVWIGFSLALALLSPSQACAEDTVENDGLPAFAPIPDCQNYPKPPPASIPCYPQPTPIPYPDIHFAGPLLESNMEVPVKASGLKRFYILPVSPATTTWGYFDASKPPALTINAGDTVAIETEVAGGGQVVPGISIDQLEYINNAIIGRGPHTMTGPIYVNGASGPDAFNQPVDFVAVHVNKIRMRSYATNNSGDSAGLFPEYRQVPPVYPNPRPHFIDTYYLDNEKMEMQFAPNIIVPLKPFPGVLSVARSEEEILLPFYLPNPEQASSPDFSMEPPPKSGWCVPIPGFLLGMKGCDTKQPGQWGGNLDIPEMTVGSTTYLPVLRKGALIWTGDSHAAQGNGEIDLDALETAYPELNVTIDVIHRQDHAEFGVWPIIETKRNWITVGYDINLSQAMTNLMQETVRFIGEKYQVSPTQATELMLKYWDCPISEVVDEVMGTYCMTPKNRLAPRAKDIPKQDTARYWVSYAWSQTDLYYAMKTAAWEAINKMRDVLGIPLGKAYALATFVLDCRIGRPSLPGEFNVTSEYKGPYAVSCMVPKSILRKPK